MSKFNDDVIKFNAMYNLPVAETPTIISAQRLRDFKAILAKELDEIDDIIVNLEVRENAAAAGAAPDPEGDLTTLVDLTDLLGDLQVYCASEMVKWGLPQGATLAIIMASNFSKLGADGQPIIDEQGKVQKGPSYFKPEPKLRKLLQLAALEAQAITLQKDLYGDGPA